MNPILFIILLISATIFSIVILYSIATINNKLSDNDNRSISVIDYITKNLRTPPIADIRLPTNGECPQDYETLVLGAWAGTVKGCQNSAGGATQECESDDTVIEAQEPRNVSSWKGQTMCYNRLTIFNYSASETCQNGYKACSNILCVPEEH